MMKPIKSEWLEKFLNGLSGPGQDVGYHLAAQVEQLRAENDELRRLLKGYTNTDLLDQLDSILDKVGKKETK